MPKMNVSHIAPPIPIRCFDWVAWIDGAEERGPYGYGKTEEEARRNLAYELAEQWAGVDPMNYKD